MNTESLIIDSDIGLCRGAFGSIIFEREGRFAYKLFKRSSHGECAQQELPDEVRRQVFEAELRAYEIVDQIPVLARHAPKFFGQIQIDCVRLANGSDVSDDYLLDCCLKLERLSGDCQKLNHLLNSFAHLAEYTRRLRDAGVRYTLDSSVFSPDNLSEFKVIDFATDDPASRFVV